MRYGKKHVPGCHCTHNFTCGECLRAAPPPIWTPLTPLERMQEPDKIRDLTGQIPKSGRNELS